MVTTQDELDGFEARLLHALLDMVEARPAPAPSGTPQRPPRWPLIASAAAVVATAALVAGLLAVLARPAAAFSVQTKPGGGLEVQIRKPLSVLEADALQRELVKAGATATVVTCSRDTLPRVVVSDKPGGRPALVIPAQPATVEVDPGPAKQAAIAAAQAALAACGVKPAPASDSSASLNPSQAALYQQLVACARANGVPSMPDAVVAADGTTHLPAPAAFPARTPSAQQNCGRTAAELHKQGIDVPSNG